MQAIRLVFLSCAAAVLAVPALAQTPPPPDPPPTQAQDPPRIVETVVVSASKTEQQLVDAAATMSVLADRRLKVAASGSYGDLLRTMPGVNVTQISARDINVTSRAAAGSLATQQLTVVDGRSLYQDFFGFTMYDFMPSNLDEIKRIEAIRGPASAIWGANALSGVVNVITKSPRELDGSSVIFGVGGFGRDVGDVNDSSGSMFYVRGTHAEAVDDQWAYKVSAGFSQTDAFARPTGMIPGGGTTYPEFTNVGTQQPKFDARVDYDFPDGRQSLQFSGGIAGTEGIMHTGIGPFDIDRGTVMGYWKVNWNRGTQRLQAFMNILDGEASNLVSVGPDGNRILLEFDTKTFDVEYGDTRVFRNQHVLNFGGNLRLNKFNLTIAPGDDSRTEGGAYIQDEFLMNDQVRLVAGARIDKFSSIENPVFSPRLAVVFKPRAERQDQSIRVSYNRAFRAPSMVNNHLDTTLSEPLPLGLINPALGSAVYLVPIRAQGNTELTEEHIDAFEVAFTGNVRDRASVSAAIYYNKYSDEIFFTQTGEYGPFSPPAGWPLPTIAWAGLYQAGFIFPSDFTYLNLGEVTNKGIELGVSGAITNEVSAYANYSFQAEPSPEFPDLTEEEALAEINLPAQHLLNLGVAYDSPDWFGSFAITRQSDAFWQDVLDARYSGLTEAYTMVNLTVGRTFMDGQYVGTLKITNLGNQEIQQHIFGDVMRRTIVAEVKVKLR